MQPEELENARLETTPELEIESTPELLPAREPVAETAPERVPFWGYTDLALVIGLLFAATLVIGLIAGGLMLSIPRLRADQTPLLVPMNLALYGALYLAIRLDFTLRHNKPVLGSLGWQRSGINLVAMGIGGVVLAIALSVLASVLHTPKIPTPFDKLTSTPLQFVLFGVMAVAIAPLFEELFFRGFIQPLLSRTFGTIAGILVTALLFGSLHLFEYAYAWQYAVFISLAGAVFGWLRVRTNSIIPSTVMHGCFNAVSVIALAFGKNI
ncbi:MAG: CPBP family intramembrane metalloprotease [Acidobacteriaceae bacterium]|nr:CPBP family intramembrane metalloprotease [Acidobacteriaceae bacterium]